MPSLISYILFGTNYSNLNEQITVPVIEIISTNI